MKGVYKYSSPEQNGVYKYLECSTAHLTQADCEALDEHPEGIVCYPYEEGAWVYVGGPHTSKGGVNIDKIEKMLPSLAACMRKARTLGCTDIKFDRDGEEHDDLPTYEW